MKTLIGILVCICTLCCRSEAQTSPSARIHFLNTMSAGLRADLKLTADPKNPIKLKSSDWVVVQTVGDSLGFVIDNKPYWLHFEPNKQYYFLIQTSHYSQPLMIEKSEREFMLTALLMSATGPREIKLGETGR